MPSIEQMGDCDVCESVDVSGSHMQPNMLMAIHYKLTKPSFVCRNCFKRYLEERGW